MLDGQTTLVPVVDESQVGEARRAMATLCERAGLDESACGSAAIARRASPT